MAKKNIPDFYTWAKQQGIDPEEYENEPDVEDYWRQQYDVTFNRNLKGKNYHVSVKYTNGTTKDVDMGYFYEDAEDYVDELSKDPNVESIRLVLNKTGKLQNVYNKETGWKRPLHSFILYDDDIEESLTEGANYNQFDLDTFVDGGAHLEKILQTTYTSAAFTTKKWEDGKPVTKYFYRDPSYFDVILKKGENVIVSNTEPVAYKKYKNGWLMIEFSELEPGILKSYDLYYDDGDESDYYDDDIEESLDETLSGLKSKKKLDILKELKKNPNYKEDPRWKEFEDELINFYRVDPSEADIDTAIYYTETDWIDSLHQMESLEEDIVKQNGKWVNKGKEGTHGEFRTKGGARRQQRAMFRNGYKGESLDEAKGKKYKVTGTLRNIWHDDDGNEVDREEWEETHTYTIDSNDLPPKDLAKVKFEDGVTRYWNKRVRHDDGSEFEVEVTSVEPLDESLTEAEEPKDIYTVFVSQKSRFSSRPTERKFKMYATSTKDAWHAMKDGSSHGLPWVIQYGDKITYVKKGEEPDAEWFIEEGRCPEEELQSYLGSRFKPRGSKEEKIPPMPDKSNELELLDWINKKRGTLGPEDKEEIDYLNKLEDNAKQMLELRAKARLNGRKNESLEESKEDDYKEIKFLKDELGYLAYSAARNPLSDKEKELKKKYEDRLRSLGKKYDLDVHWYVRESLDEAKNDTLNPAIWENDELKPEVKEKLQFIADKFIEKLTEDDIPLDVDDIVIVGSNRNYNYGPQSDIDLHIIRDLSEFKGREKELAEKIYQRKKSIFNDKYDPTINGFEVEIYVEPAEDKNDNDIPDEVEEPLEEQFKKPSKDVIEQMYNMITSFEGEISGIELGEFARKFNLENVEAAEKVIDCIKGGSDTLDNGDPWWSLIKEEIMEDKDLEEGLVQLSEEDIKHFESQLDELGFDIEGKGRTTFGNLHYQVILRGDHLTEQDLRRAAKRLNMLSDKMDDLGIPMTYNVGLTYNDEITAGLDLHKKYVKEEESLEEDVPDYDYGYNDAFDKAHEMDYYGYEDEHFEEIPCPCHEDEFLVWTGTQGKSDEFKCPVCGKYYYRKEGSDELTTDYEESLTESAHDEIDQIYDFLSNEGLGYFDVSDGGNGLVVVSIEWGDWKHEHLRCDRLMMQIGYGLEDEEVTDEDGSDTYSSNHIYKCYVPGLLKHYVGESLTEGAYTRKELIDKFGTDDLDLINAGREENVELKDESLTEEKAKKASENTKRKWTSIAARRKGLSSFSKWVEEQGYDIDEVDDDKKLSDELQSKYREFVRSNKSLKEDLDSDIDDFYSEFDPSGDEMSGFVAYDWNELNRWTDWLDSRGISYDVNEITDPDDGLYGEAVAYLNLNESLTEGANGSVEDYLKQMKKTGNPEKVMKNAKGNPNAEKAYKQFKETKKEPLKEDFDEADFESYKEYILDEFDDNGDVDPDRWYETVMEDFEDRELAEAIYQFCVQLNNGEYYDADHAAEWMERNPHGYYNNESDYGTGEQDESLNESEDVEEDKPYVVYDDDLENDYRFNTEQEAVECAKKLLADGKTKHASVYYKWSNPSDPYSDSYSQLMWDESDLDEPTYDELMDYAHSDDQD